MSGFVTRRLWAHPRPGYTGGVWSLLACTGAPVADLPLPDTGPDCADVRLTEAFEHAIDGLATDCEADAIEAYVASRLTDVGPWQQDIRVAFSEDAQTFTALDGVVVETAAVPEVAIDADGRYWLFYVDGDYDRFVTLTRERSTWMATHGIPGLGALSAMVSDDGRTFEPVPDFAIEGVVRGMVVDPDVVLQPDGTWRMYYVGMTVPEYLETATWVYPEAHSIYWASSTDLVHWRQEGEVVRGPYADPSVLCRADDSCLMASFGVEWGRSTDGGVTFTHDGAGEETGFAPEFVRMEDGSVRAFYNAAAVGAPFLSMYAANDAAPFVVEPGERMPGTYGEAPTLGRAFPTGWYMWFHTFKDGIDPPI